MATSSTTDATINMVQTSPDTTTPGTASLTATSSTGSCSSAFRAIPSRADLVTMC